MKIFLKGKQQIFEDIAEQYKRFIEHGVYNDGDKLPSCRALALELGINPNTVERAYAKLESEGYITVLPKKGVYVSHSQKQDEWLDAKVQIGMLKSSGIDKSTVLKIIEEVYRGEEND